MLDFWGKLWYNSHAIERQGKTLVHNPCTFQTAYNHM